MSVLFYTYNYATYNYFFKYRGNIYSLGEHEIVELDAYTCIYNAAHFA